jgi:hypothetical protein
MYDYVGEGNTVRVVDAFINKLDMVVLGFEGASPATTEGVASNICDEDSMLIAQQSP